MIPVAPPAPVERPRRYLEQPVNPQDGGDPREFDRWLDEVSEAIAERDAYEDWT